MCIMDQMVDHIGTFHNYACGSVADVFNRERDSRLRYPHMQSVVSAWMRYGGGEVPPFEAYMRWARNGSFVTLSTIAADGQKMGRMPVIMDALECMAPEVRVESVCNPHLASWLHRRGYSKQQLESSPWVDTGWPGDWHKFVK